MEWDPLLHHVLLKKLDVATHELYEQSLINPRGLQNTTDLLAFLESRFQALEILRANAKQFQASEKKTVLSATTEKMDNCALCKRESHAITRVLQISKVRQATTL